jgi:microsomal dipeptidase-like Zn-dependent dipeptidase
MNPLLLCWLLTTPVRADPAPEPEPALVQIDWQAHPAMHIPWKMFGRGLTDRALSRRTWRHQFRQTMSRPALEASETRIVLAAAMAAERARNPRQARRLILKQLRYIEDFVVEHPDRFALARSPEEVRRLLVETDKIILVHSIEGGHHLLWEDGDAAFWAEQGVALVTLIHLRDRELGGAFLLDGALGRIINPRGARRERRGEDRGLTEHGRASIVALDEAGIVVDYSHMDLDALDDALDVSAEHQIPPVLTHGRLDRVYDGQFGISEEQLVEVYRLGGVFSLGLSAIDVTAEHASATPPEGLCWQSLEAWGWHHQEVQQILSAHVAEIFEEPGLTMSGLDEAQRVRLATGWSSDWNGWVSHSVPTHGRGRCESEEEATLDIDVRGLAHPGLLPQHWQRLEEAGVELAPMMRSAERFLQLWEAARDPVR